MSPVADNTPVPEVSTTFGVYGSFDPAEVTSILGIQPTRSARKGERLRTGLKAIPVEDSWTLKSEEVKSLDGTAMVSSALQHLESLDTKLRELRRRIPDAKIGLTLVAYVPSHPHSAVPSISLDNALLKRLCKLDIDFDIDYMLLGPDDSE